MGRVFQPRKRYAEIQRTARPARRKAGEPRSTDSYVGPGNRLGRSVASLADAHLRDGSDRRSGIDPHAGVSAGATPPLQRTLLYPLGVSMADSSAVVSTGPGLPATGTAPRPATQPVPDSSAINQPPASTLPPLIAPRSPGAYALWIDAVAPDGACFSFHRTIRVAPEEKEPGGNEPGGNEPAPNDPALPFRQIL